MWPWSVQLLRGVWQQLQSEEASPNRLPFSFSLQVNVKKKTAKRKRSHIATRFQAVDVMIAVL